jgi:hypothetical protein
MLILRFNKMRKRLRRYLAVLVVIAVLCFLGDWLWFGGASDPKLSVAYLRTIDGNGTWRLEFGITNIGRRPVFTSHFGNIEIFNHTNLISIGATSPKQELAPGEGQVVDAVLSPAQMDSIGEKWRYTCLYARDGLRSQIYNLQWGPGGPGKRVNWMIPRALKGMPLTVKGTSDWVEPAARTE